MKEQTQFKREDDGTELEKRLEWVDKETWSMAVGFVGCMAMAIGLLTLFVFLAWHFAP